MKSLRKFIAPLVLSVLAVLAMPAKAQVTPTTIFVLTNNIPASVTTNTAVIIGGTNNPNGGAWQPTNNIISLRQGQGMAAFDVFDGTNASCTGNFVVSWAVSGDGTNWAYPVLPMTTSASGTNTVTGYTNYAGALLNNALYISPYSISNANTAGNCGINIGSFTISFGNVIPGAYGN